MMIALHQQSRTTPAARTDIAASRESVAALTKRYGISDATERKWKSRTDFMDHPHTAHRPQNILQDLTQTLSCFLYLYNHQLPQSAFGSQTPIQATRRWYQFHTRLFVRSHYDRPGLFTAEVLPGLFLSSRHTAQHIEQAVASLTDSWQ